MKNISFVQSLSEKQKFVQKKAGQFNFRNEKFNSRREESTSQFPIKPPRPQGDEVISGGERTLGQKTSHCGLLVQQAARDEVGKNMNDAPMFPTTSGSSKPIRCSRPLLPPAGNINQMPRDHDRRNVLLETSRQPHVDKGKQKRGQSESIAFALPTNTLYIGPRNRSKQ